jgi:hypothetical protein
MVGAKPRASLTSELHRLLPRHYAVVFNQQSGSLCQATLSIGPYLLLEGPVPTVESYPAARVLNVVNEVFSEVAPAFVSIHT